MYASTVSWQNGLIKPIILISIEIEFGIAIFYNLSAFRISNTRKITSSARFVSARSSFRLRCIRAFYVYRDGEKTW